MTYAQAKRAVLEKVALQRCWRALNPDLSPEVIEVPCHRYRGNLQIENIWSRGPRSRKAAMIRTILRSEASQRVTAYNMTLPF
jgi:hypothetical protein